MEQNPNFDVHEDVEEQTSVGEVVVNVLPHKRSAPIWQHYNLVVTNLNNQKAQCKTCGNLYSIGGNSTLRRHHQACMARQGQQRNQPTIDAQGNAWVFDEQLCREMTTKCVIQKGMPFGFFADKDLVRLIQRAMQPRFHPVSRQTLKRDALKMWEMAKTEMQTFFDQFNQMVSLTCDIWTAGHGSPYSYVCITAHWVEPETWILVKRVIAFDQFGNPHSATRLHRLITRCVDYYKLQNKVISISFDNASNNTGCADLLKLSMRPMLHGELFHSRCIAHIINLAVQAGLSSLSPHIYKLKLLLTRIFASGQTRHNQFLQYCRHINHQPLGPNFDMPVRWNSTYNMIDNAIKQKDVLQTFYNMHWPQNKFHENNWMALVNIHDFLECFKYATTLLSGVYYATSPLILTQIYIMASKMKSYENDEIMGDAVTAMQLKLLKYFKEIPLAVLCAGALHPFLNVMGVEMLIRNIADCFDLTTNFPQIAEETIVKFNTAFRELFDIYKQKYGMTGRESSFFQSRTGASSSSSSQRQSRSDIMLNVVNSLVTERTRKGRNDSDFSELRMYASADWNMEPNMAEQFDTLDLLSWWKQHSNQFPVLSKMARDLLTIQASTVASESSFSLSGRIISERRTKLTPQSVEMCVCLKDYLDSIDRIQHLTSLEQEVQDVEQIIEEIEIEEQESASYNSDARSNTTFEDDDFDEDEPTNYYQDTFHMTESQYYYDPNPPRSRSRTQSRRQQSSSQYDDSETQE